MGEQGRCKTPSTLLRPPDPYETDAVSHAFLRHRKGGRGSSVGVGGAWEGGWGPRADPVGWDTPAGTVRYLSGIDPCGRLPPQLSPRQ